MFVMMETKRKNFVISVNSIKLYCCLYADDFNLTACINFIKYFIMKHGSESDRKLSSAASNTSGALRIRRKPSASPATAKDPKKQPDPAKFASFAKTPTRATTVTRREPRPNRKQRHLWSRRKCIPRNVCPSSLCVSLLPNAGNISRISSTAISMQKKRWFHFNFSVSVLYNYMKRPNAVFLSNLLSLKIKYVKKQIPDCGTRDFEWPCWSERCCPGSCDIQLPWDYSL